MPRIPAMTGALKTVYLTNLATARDSRVSMPDRWAAIERAHILSQPWPWPHTTTHAVMLRLGAKERDLVEVLGQLLRLAVGGIGSALGRYPDGNTGRTRVGINTPMPMPADLEKLLADAGIRTAPTTVDS